MELAYESSVFKSNASNCIRMYDGLKPSELAPLSSMILAEIIDEVKFSKEYLI
jgi:hypothetical protein